MVRHRPASARVRRRRALAVLLLTTLVVVLLWRATRAAGVDETQAAGPASAKAPTRPPAAQDRAPASAPVRQVPGPLGSVAGVGPHTVASVPASSTQVVLVRGDAASVATTAVELYQRTATGWVVAGRWRGHVGAKGWTSAHREGDLRTPTGTYTLSDAGGLQADPGTALPYHRSPSFVPTGDSVFGDSLEGSFDHVIAIDYNRRPGRSPLDDERPRGRARGGGIWLHVDHGGPTHGCVSMPLAGLQQLMRALVPAQHPVVVMADRARLAA